MRTFPITPLLHWLRFALLGVVLLLCPLLATADDESSLRADLSAWQSTIQRAQEALDTNFLYADSGSIASELNRVLQRAREAEQAAQRALADGQEQLDKLRSLSEDKTGNGEDEDAADNDDMAELKKMLQQRISNETSSLTRIELVLSQARKALERLASWEQAWMRALIFQRLPLPTNTEVWRASVVDLYAFVSQVASAPKTWWEERKQLPAWQLHALWVLPILGVLIGWPVRVFILRRYGRSSRELEPSYTRRILKASINSLATAIMPVAIIGIELLLLKWMGLLDGLFGSLVYVAAMSLSAFIIVFGLADAALSPNLVQWRIVPVKPTHARKLLSAIGTVFGLFAISFGFMGIAWKFEQLTPPMESVFYLFQTTIMAFAIAWLLTPKYWAPSIDASQEFGTAEEDSEAEEAADTKGTNEPPRAKPIWLKAIRMMRVLILLTPLLTVAGYGRFVFHFQSRLLFTIGVVGITILLRLVLKESLEQLFLGRRRRGKGRWATRQDPETDVKIMAYWAGLLLNLLLLIPVAYLLLWSYGVPPITLKLWTRSLLAGVTMGNITISFTDIITALVMLIVGLFLTSLVRRWMTNSLLPNTRLDSGARDSIAAGTSYMGVFIAIIVSVVALGIDFSSLALVAGALSVGIGFGLQNLVQNFAAGIMLLVERPIKVGDMIVVNDEFGEVRRISVRATEVETYDRCTIFIPNSDLIANNLVNWSHNNRHARLRLPVHTAYGSDPKKVEEVLLECANAHPNVLWYPASYVWFRGFANGVQNYELRVYINDVDNWVVVNHDVYVNIEHAFREHGIEIPVPPREIFMNQRPRIDREGLDDLPGEGELSAPNLSKPTGGLPVDGKASPYKAPGGIGEGGLGGDGAK